MKSTDHVGITFANLVLASGIYNGVVNVTIGAYHFEPIDDKVEPSPAITARLRMDVACARALRDNLTELLLKVEAPIVAEGVAVESNAAANGAAKH